VHWLTFGCGTAKRAGKAPALLGQVVKIIICEDKAGAGVKALTLSEQLAIFKVHWVTIPGKIGGQAAKPCVGIKT
jgi:hypothetical protein